MAKKVKLFQSVVSVSGGSSGGNFSDIEQQINDFFSSNSQIELIDVRLASNGAPVGNIVTNYGLIALVIYMEH
jgi:hypothetical protein